MKKWILVIITILLFFLPFHVFAAEKEISDEPLTCNSNQDSNCRAITVNSYFFDSETLKYKMEEDGFLGIDSDLFSMKNAYSNKVEVGPATLYSTYLTYFSTTKWDDIYYEYNLKEGIVYYFNYTFYGIGPFNENLKMSSFIPVSASGMFKDTHYSNDDSFYSFQGFTVTYSNEIDNSWYLDNYPELDTKITISFKFAFSKPLDKFQFSFGKKSFSDEDLDNKFAFLALQKTVLTPNTRNMYYVDFSLTESADIIHGGGGADLDNPTSKDESIFSNLKTCEKGDGILDVGGWLKFLGCIIENIFTLIKNVFIRIGNFFLEILKFIVEFPLELFDFFKTILSPKLLNLEILFNKLNDFVVTNEGGLTSIITAPLNLIKNLSNSSCSSLVLSIPLVNSAITLPCMSSIYQNYFGSLFSIYQTITTGFIAYWCLINLLRMINSFKDPQEDKIEVMEL